MEAAAPERYILRRRIDTEQQVGMAISDTSLEMHSSRSQSPSTLGQEVVTNEYLVIDPQEERLVQSLILQQIEFAESGELEEKLWALTVFKFLVMGIFALLSLTVVCIELGI